MSSARQLDETVGQFLARLPPATTRVTLNCPWIYIWNPSIPADRKKPGQEDGDAVGGGELTDEFITRAQKRFDQYKGFVENNRTKTGRISAKIKEEGRNFTDDILKLAGQLGVTEGKVSELVLQQPPPRWSLYRCLCVTNITSGLSTQRLNTAVMCGQR